MKTGGGRFVLWLALAVIGRCACPSGYTPVVDTITNTVNTGNAALFNGYVVIAAPTVPVSNSSGTFGRTPITLQVVNGALSVCLVPNDTATPSGTGYAVSYQDNGGQKWTEAWVVPTSTTPLLVRNVRQVNGLPTPFYAWTWNLLTLPAGGVTLPGVTVGTFSARYSAVTYSATPIFDLSLANVFKITLSGNVTAPTFPNANSGETYTVIICQDGAGSHTWVWPSRVHGGITIGTSASACSVQEFVSDGDNLYAKTVGVVNQ